MSTAAMRTVHRGGGNRVVGGGWVIQLAVRRSQRLGRASSTECKVGIAVKWNQKECMVTKEQERRKKFWPLELA